MSVIVAVNVFVCVLGMNGLYVVLITGGFVSSIIACACVVLSPTASVQVTLHVWLPSL